MRAMINGPLVHLVQLTLIGGGGKMVELPSHFLIPDHPTRDNQVVVVLEGERKGVAFKTMKIEGNPASFKLSPIGLRKRKAQLEMEASKLALADLK